MLKVKTTYAYKIQSIVKEFLDEFMESFNNQLITLQFVLLCGFLLILIEIRRNFKKR